LQAKSQAQPAFVIEADSNKKATHDRVAFSFLKLPFLDLSRTKFLRVFETVQITGIAGYR